MTTKCKQCGEQIAKTGNYTFRILPAKRIPKKAKKLIKADKVGEDEQRSSYEMTKFHKFLLKRSKPANIMEVTCGKCGGISRIKMLKPECGRNKAGILEENEGIKAYDITNRLVASSNRERSNMKSRRDNTAGLTIPGRSPMEGRKNSLKESRPQKKSNSTAKRQKELENLNKMLFSSKKAKKSGSTLQDFLSSI